MGQQNVTGIVMSSFGKSGLLDSRARLWDLSVGLRQK